MKNALLEIGVEHLPARFVEGALRQMEALAAEQFAKYNISYASLRAFGTFRKIALHIEGLEPKSKDISKEIKGPPAKLLKDANGNFTPQSAGFAQKNGIKPEKLSVVETPNGPFIYAKIKIKGEATKKLLPQIFTNIVTSLQFPKNMVWEESGLRFARPIRTLIGLYGDAVIKFKVAGVESGRTTWPLSSFGTKGIKIASADSYIETLKNQPQPILAEPEERKEVLAKAIAKEGELRNLTSVISEDLLNETVYMTEHPVAVPGDFEIRFLTLPKELIITVLKKQIKMFHMVNKDGGIEPYFIAVRDGMSVNQQEVMEGFKKVMSARLSDAIFFYNQDLNKGLNAFKEKLATVRFIDGLGTMLDKTERTKKLALWLAEKCGAKKDIVGQAADYCYADLTSSVVYEFPELQGYMGGVYALKENKPTETAKALEEFYFPLTSTSELPSTLESAIVSLAGKMDAVTGNFLTGQIPTGSEDPFALRRQAIGIVRMMLDYNMPIAPKELVDYSVKLYEKETDVYCALEAFLDARMSNLLENESIDTKVIMCVSGNAAKPFTHTLQVAKALQNMKENEDLKTVGESAKRVINILKKAEFDAASVNSTLFEHDAERNLLTAVEKTEKELIKYNKTLTVKDCEEIFALLAGFKGELASFFDSVMVNSDKEEIRKNRLNLLNKTASLLTVIADITKLN
ncbi:Glycyl-tRNA synthetase, beta subunit [Elusimicrobium minutum Pei191]|uniref:Glycine--tRNA ligase beta subunit n=1 Tax=Elusimicrobium minutum (strain Pei191) TaxID=445932 RepID=B2KBR1_ELUMP|nr:glycine--tRNA ligase subunit beta [Elusimicrobium minutum]ACC97748.1 Glycyl-tRNA synthetase, beta subunit [Elusimicrobium minutum Pei191]